MKEITKKLTKNATHAAKEIRKQTGIALAAAFAFVIAFSWNEFLKEVVNSSVSIFGVHNVVLLRFLAAVFATIIGVIGIGYFAKMGK